MICFGIKTDQERKIKEHEGPTSKKMIKRSKLRGDTEGLRERGGEGENF